MKAEAAHAQYATVPITPPVSCDVLVPAADGDGNVVAYGVAIAVAGYDALILFEDGVISWWGYERVTLKYQPDGPWRLALGWARKGPDGNGRSYE